MPELMHEGSAKDFYIESAPTNDGFGTGYLFFKQRPDGTGPISVFDLKERFPFGVMGKDEALHDETAHFFQLMERNGVPTHYLGDMGSQKVRVYVAHIPPEDDWENWFRERGSKPSLVPVEVILSKTVTPPASLHRKLGKDPAKYGLKEAPGRYDTVELAKPWVATSTKLGPTDIYVDDLLDRIGLGGTKDRLIEMALQAEEISRQDAEKVGLNLADGKFEFIVGPDGRFYIADSYYNSDECRLLAETDGGMVDLSKQFLRNLLIINGYKAQLDVAKDLGMAFEAWPVPDLLDDETMRTIEKSYAVVRQQLCRKDLGLKLGGVATEVSDVLKRFRDRYKRDETGQSL